MCVRGPSRFELSVVSSFEYSNSSIYRRQRCEGDNLTAGALRRRRLVSQEIADYLLIKFILLLFIC